MNRKGFTVTEVTITLGIIAVVIIAGIKIISSKYSQSNSAKDKMVTISFNYLKKELKSEKSCKQSFSGKNLYRKQSYSSIKSSNGVAQLETGSKVSSDYIFSKIETRHVDKLENGINMVLLKLTFRSTNRNRNNIIFRNFLRTKLSSDGRIERCQFAMPLNFQKE